MKMGFLQWFCQYYCPHTFCRTVLNNNHFLFNLILNKEVWYIDVFQSFLTGWFSIHLHCNATFVVLKYCVLSPGILGSQGSTWYKGFATVHHLLQFSQLLWNFLHSVFILMKNWWQPMPRIIITPLCHMQLTLVTCNETMYHFITQICSVENFKVIFFNNLYLHLLF